jgi:hypothetical protein
MPVAIAPGPINLAAVIPRRFNARTLALVAVAVSLGGALTGAEPAPPPGVASGVAAPPAPKAAKSTTTIPKERRLVPITVLSAYGSQFLLNGQPTFLYGISYYGALGASRETVRRDLADMRRHHFNWIRVWATWAAFENDVSAVDAEGHPRDEYLARLKAIVIECDRRRMVVDVTLSRGNGVTGPPRLQSLEAQRQAVKTIVETLRPWRNWYLDLSNERNIKDKRYTSLEELQELRELVRQLDPKRLVTASHAGDLTRSDVGKYVKSVKLDFLSPHRPRGEGSTAQTGAKVTEWQEELKRVGRLAPVHLQEPFRRGFGAWEPKAEDFVQDALAARKAGAAGWCFHNGDERARPDGQPRRSFDLREQRLFEQLDEQELRAIRLLEREF